MKKIILIIILFIFSNTIVFSMEKNMRGRRNGLIINFFMIQFSNIVTETYKETYKRIAIYNVNIGEKIIKNTYYFINLTKDKIQSGRINNKKNIKIPLQIEVDDSQKYNYMNLKNKYPTNISYSIEC